MARESGGQPTPRDGSVTWRKLAGGLVATGPNTIAAGSHKEQHEPGGADALTNLTDASFAAANVNGAANKPSLRTTDGGPGAAIGDPGGSDGAVLVRSGGQWAELAIGGVGRNLIVRSDNTIGWTDPLMLNAKAFLAQGDGRAFGQNSITGGQAVLTCSANLFVLSDVGKTITVQDAGVSGDSFTTTILSYQSAGQVTLAANAATTVAGVSVWIGTDDTTALRNFIAACIATGAHGIVPPGNYVITGVLDFSAMVGEARGVTFEGAGAGAMNKPNWDSATNFWVSYAGPAFTAFGSSSPSANTIVGLKMRGFAVKNLHLIGAANWTIYWDYVQNCEMSDIAVSGYSTHAGAFNQTGQGNGVWVNNMPQGQITIKRVHAGYFNDVASEGWRFGAATTAHATAANSGNSTMEACICVGCYHGFHFKSDSMTNGNTFISLKTVAPAGAQTGYGFWLDAFQQGHVFHAPHAEGHFIGYYLNGAIGNTFNSPLASYLGGSIGDGSNGFKFDTSAVGNEVHAGQIGGYDTGVVTASNTQGNRINVFFTGTQLTAKYSLAGNNTYVDLKQPYCAVSLTHSASQSIASGSQTGMSFDTENFKTDVVGATSMHSNALNNPRITVPIAGKYRVHIGVRFSNPTTTIAAGSNGAVLPQATINVASTAGFQSSGTVKIGSDTVAYTGITGTTLTGCTGGTGTLATGETVTGNGGVGERYVALRKNGSTFYQGVRVNADQSAQTEVGFSQVIGLAAGDYLEAVPYQNSGQSLGLGASGGNYGQPAFFVEYMYP